MGRRCIGAFVFCVLTTLASSSPAKDKDGPPVPQEASGAWSSSSGSVDTNSGAAVATYPFELPPARGAIQPSLGLVYRHTAGPSEVGEGWSLGLPEIVRRGVASGPPLFDNTDHFELSGQLLVECTGSCDQEPRPTWAGSGWSHYRGRAERSPIHLYHKVDNAGGRTWRLQLAQGGFAELGYPEVGTSPGPLDHGGVDVARLSPTSTEIYRWKLVRMVEAAPGNAWRNVVAFKWRHLLIAAVNEDSTRPGPGVSVLTDVFYTPHPGHPLSAFDQYGHHIKLDYEFWRTAVEIASPPIWRSFPVVRLTTVSIASRGINPSAGRERVRVYRFGYRAESIRRHPFLESIQMEGRCTTPIIEELQGPEYRLPNATCASLAPTTFEYTPERGRFNPTTGIYEGIVTQSVRFIDEHDDPIQSVFQQKAINERQITLVDVNKDGLPDLFAFRGANPTIDAAAEHEGFVFINPGGNSFETIRRFKREPVGGSKGSLGAGILSVFGDWSSTTNGWSPGSASVGFLFRPENTDPTVFPSLLRGIVRNPEPLASWHISETPMSAIGTARNPHVFGDFDDDGTLDALYVHPGTNATSDSDDTVRLALSKRTTRRFVEGPPTGLFLSKSPSAPSFWALADMNGDGLVDYVTLRRPLASAPSDLVYIPRNASLEAILPFGCDLLPPTVPPASDPCTPAVASPGFNPNTNVALREVLLENAPVFNPDKKPNQLYFHDVTGDGLADIITLTDRGATVDNAASVDIALFINLDGKRFASAVSHSVFTENDPVSGELALFADMNGNGVDDLVLVGKDAAVIVDFQGNQRPGLLTTINHSSGATTTFSYELLADHEKQFPADRWTTELGPWRYHSPVPMHVVTRTQTASGAPSPYDFTSTTSYTYREPVFDRWRGRLAGFRRVRAARSTLATETQYFFGACLPEDRADVDATKCPDQEGDPELVVNGLPVIVEQRSLASSAPVYASTTVYSYAVNSAGAMNMVYPEGVNTFIYDLSNYVPSGVSVQIPLFVIPGREPEPHTVPLRASGIRVRSRQTVDAAWRQTVSVQDGRVDATGLPIDWPIITNIQWDTFTDGGVHRPKRTTIAYGNLGTPPRLVPDGPTRTVDYAYDTAGRLRSATAPMSGALPLERFHASGLAVADDPPLITSPVQLFTNTYDEYGRPTTVRGASSECTVTVFEAPYFDTVQAIHESTDGSCSLLTSLRTGYSVDRGLGAVTRASAPTGSQVRNEHDSFGRLIRVLETPGDGAALVPTLDVTHFDVNPYTDAFSRVHKSRVVRTDPNGNAARTTWLHTSSLGMPIMTFTEADESAGDTAPWIVQPGPIVLDDFGLPVDIFRPQFHSSSPTNLFGTVPLRDKIVFYDFMGRPSFIRRDSDQQIVDRRVYRPLSVDFYDFENIGAPFPVQGSHVGQFVTIDFDGRGRQMRTTKQRAAVFGGPFVTNLDRLPTGEISAVQRNFLEPSTNTPRSVLRWFRFDSLGRVVENAEPNTSKNFSADPTNAASMLAWRYAYDRSGRLTGTRDARGCGKNLHYDPAGRLIAEDVSPCLASHAPYSTPNLTTGAGTEAFYHYDSPEPGQTDDFGPSSLNLRGKLVSVRDRGAHTRFAYDARGRTIGVARRIAKPGSPSNDLQARYAAHWFHTATEYDDFDRATKMSTGAESPELLEAGESAMTMAYGLRDRPKAIGSSYGTLGAQFVFDADGFQREVAYGSGVAKVRRTPDLERRLRRSEVFRSAPAVWSDPAYTPPTDADELRMAHQLLLADSTFSRDGVGNILAIADGRDRSLWVDGTKPRDSTMAYDDEYRLTSVNYGTLDDQISPFAREEATADGRPLPRTTFALRIGQQAFGHDGYGNLIAGASSDSLTFDRALGTTTHGFDVSKPGQLFSSDGASSGGGFDAYYDDSGNLAGLDLERAGSCSAPTFKCSQRLLYDWDEVGQLVRARRWDYDTLVANPVHPSVPSTTPAAELEYQYSQGERVVRRLHDSSASPRYTVDVFGSLRLTNATFDTTASTYEQTAGTETVFLAGGARVFHASGLPNVGSDRHVFLTIGDRLGSANVVLDKDTGELVEHITYQSYGAVDSDYRTARWSAFREDRRFTGKEEDIELGLQYFGARYYSPNLGRFISPDPVTIHAAQGDINPYAYVRGRVYNAVDPFGLDGQCIGRECTGMGDANGGTINLGDTYDAVRCLFGGCGGGAGGASSSNASRGPSTPPPPPFNAYVVYSPVTPILATGAFQQTGLGMISTAFINPVQDKREYVGALGAGALTGAFGFSALAGNSLGHGPRQLFFVTNTPDAHRGFGDGLGVVGVASGGIGMLGAAASLGAELTAAEETVSFYHGTTRSAAWNIMLRGGLRPGADGAVFLAEDIATAEEFGEVAVRERGAQSGTVLRFDVPKSLGLAFLAWANWPVPRRAGTVPHPWFDGLRTDLAWRRGGRFQCRSRERRDSRHAGSNRGLVMDKETRAVLSQLLRRRDPTPAVLLEVERLGDVGVDAICELLQEGDLSPQQQYRALQGLAYASKHGGSREHRLVLERALERTSAENIALRSRAVHTAILTLSILARRHPELGTQGHPLRARVASAAREALKLRLHPASERAVRRFLGNEE